METVRYDGDEVAVREVSRPNGWSCRHLVSVDGVRQFLEYLVSVGPHKFDVARVHELDPGQIQGYESGALRLGELARRLAEEDDRGGRT